VHEPGSTSPVIFPLLLSIRLLIHVGRILTTFPAFRGPTFHLSLLSPDFFFYRIGALFSCVLPCFFLFLTDSTDLDPRGLLLFEGTSTLTELYSPRPLRPPAFPASHSLAPATPSFVHLPSSSLPNSVSVFFFSGPRTRQHVFCCCSY